MRIPCRTHVDEELLERFKSRFGNYGAISYCLEAAMTEALEMTDGFPEHAELFKSAIRTHVLKHQFNPKKPVSI